MSAVQKIGNNKQVPGKPFKKGEGGRPKGIPNKSTGKVKDVFANVFTELQDDPEACLSTWGKANPTEFYKLAAKLIPLQLSNAEGEDFKITLNLVNPLEPK